MNPFDGRNEAKMSAEKLTFAFNQHEFPNIFRFGDTKVDLNAFGSLSIDSKPKDDKIIVGVDYGTTFTGASYVSSEATDLKDIQIIQSWPGPARDMELVFKVPSRIAYAADNPRAPKDRWGFQVEAGMIGYSWTKLLLDEGTPLTRYDDAALETASQAGILRLPEGKKATDVVCDYLSGVYEHILKTISKSITEETLAATPIEFWFTIPAIWSDQAQHATRTAALRAGFGGTAARKTDRVFLITEPEAAAIAALSKYSTTNLGRPIAAGDGVLVCDCGGGTVDITTYFVRNVKPLLEFEELCTGIGGKCGSTAVDRNFYKLMSERFGEAFDDLPIKRKSPGSGFMRAFESIKRDFGSSDEENTFELPLNITLVDPDPKYYDEEERMVIVSSNDLRNMFDPVVDQILDLVKEQLEDAKEEAGQDVINRIVLVGGFGDSEYLRKAFRSTFESDGKISVTVPEIPQAAIVQGAALRGLEGLRSTTRRCRRHYGYSTVVPFRTGIDDDRRSYWDDYTDQKMARGIMKWAIAKGEVYADNRTETFPLGWKHYSSSNWTPTITFYACDQATAPQRDNDKGVYPVGNISVDFSGVDFSRFSSKLINGQLVYDVRLQLKVIFGAEEGVLKFEATSQGRSIGRTSINFHMAKYY
ncbi:Hsp70 family protein [Aspergillus undulatus]|uniref:Hsp70 family protein n=1 Tax=Aspergillus undulatus TaxID=1810928 RepID=UPI003CCD7808